MTKYSVSRGHEGSETGVEFGLAELCGDSARMVPHWVAPPEDVPSAPVSPSLIHGVVVPAASARLIDATAEYGA
ncbi:hypothetical protein [Streptomyces sp. NPDC006368]|uniref:hypothetical protein n=1 Tax=Streptomyces sp. NPDC006368 TaxID=3156760 RepID=UPI0033BC9178